jgi:hypothetical protein
MMITALFLSVVLFDTPTPTPTPTPGPGNAQISSFYVPPVAPPWAVPILPTWGTGTPVPTPYAATPVHGTEYPDQAATATAQVAGFTAPIDTISTPIAAMVAAGPTASADDIDTGIDPLGDGAIKFSDISDQVTSGVEDVASGAKGFAQDLGDMVVYSPWLAPIPLMLILPTLIGMFLSTISLIIKGVMWLWNFVIKLLTLLGVIVPG